MRKFKITANKEQLLSVGIDYDLTGMVGTYKNKFVTGWYLIEVTHYVGNMEFTNEFDLPKTFLKEI